MNSNQRRAESEVRLHFLDGIRGWGALVVVLYHVYIEIYPASAAAQAVMKRIFVFNGMLAVILFFVVSGVSLSAGFLQTGDPIRLKRMAIGRYFRLTLPIFLSCLLVFGCSRLGLLPVPFRTPATDNLADLFKFAFFDVYFDYRSGFSPIPPLWTMSYELVGSVIVLVTLAFAGRQRFGTGKYVAIYLALSALLFNAFPLYACFTVGIALAEVRLSEMSSNFERVLSRVATLGIVPMAIAAAWLPGNPDLRIWTLIGSGLTACLICSAAARKFLSSPISMFLGELSFPLYLLHALVIRVVGTPILSSLHSPVLIALGDAAMVIVAVAVGWLLRPIDRIGIVASRAAAKLAFRRQINPTVTESAQKQTESQ